jgi:hypothetical protein
VVPSLLFHFSVALGYTPETSQKLTISLAPFQRATSDIRCIGQAIDRWKSGFQGGAQRP